MAKVKNLLNIIESNDKKLLDEFWGKEIKTIEKLVKEAKGSHSDKVDYVVVQLIQLITMSSVFEDKYSQLADLLNKKGANKSVIDLLKSKVSQVIK
jgi:hypothetical protein